MTPGRRRFYRVALVVGGTLLGVSLLALDLHGQRLDAGVAPELSWLGWTGLLALLGVAVVWGQLREQSRFHEGQIKRLFHAVETVVPRGEVDARFAATQANMDKRLDRMDALLDRMDSQRYRGEGHS